MTATWRGLDAQRQPAAGPPHRPPKPEAPVMKIFKAFTAFKYTTEVSGLTLDWADREKC
jgi:hypothetical protein